MLPKWCNWVFITFIAIVVIVFGWWFIPRIFGLVYQIRGGRLLDEAIQVAQDIQPENIICATEPTSDELAMSLTEDAISFLNKAVSFNPNLPQVYLLLGRANCMIGKAEEAVNYLSEYTRKRPNSPLGNLESGFGYLAMGIQKSQFGSREPCLNRTHHNGEDLEVIYTAASHFRNSDINREQILDLADNSISHGKLQNASCFFHLAKILGMHLSQENEFIWYLTTVLARSRYSLNQEYEFNSVYTITDSLILDSENLFWIQPSKVAGQPLTQKLLGDFNAGVMWWNGSAGAVIKVEDPGNFRLSFLGLHSEPQPIELALEQNFVEVDRFFLSKGDLSWQELDTEVYLDQGLHLISVRYMNDGVDTELDRNAYIDWVKVERK